MAVDAKAMIAATDRSISPEMMSNVIAKAMSAFSVKLKVASERFQALRKYGEANELAMKIAIATPNNNISQLANSRV